MNTTVEQFLSELVIKTAKHFSLDMQDALAAVAQSKLANELSNNGNISNLTTDQLCDQLYDEIANAR